VSGGDDARFTLAADLGGRGVGVDVVRGEPGGVSPAPDVVGACESSEASLFDPSMPRQPFASSQPRLRFGRLSFRGSSPPPFDEPSRFRREVPFRMEFVEWHFGSMCRLSNTANSADWFVGLDFSVDDF
jgi:hypothetical protein